MQHTRRLILFMGFIVVLILLPGKAQASPTVSFTLTILPSPEVQNPVAQVAVEKSQPPSEELAPTVNPVSQQATIGTPTNTSIEQIYTPSVAIVDNTTAHSGRTDATIPNFEPLIRAGPN